MENNHKKNLLIFGGSGDIGKMFCKLVSEKGDINIYASYYVNKPNDEDSIKYFYFDAENSDYSALRSNIGYDIHYFIFCVGVNSEKRIISETTSSEWIRLMNINALSFANLYRELHHNLRNGQAKILVVSSVAAKDCKEKSAPYSASKACLESIAITLSKEEKQYGVNINILEISLVDSKLARKLVKLKGYDWDIYLKDEINGIILTKEQVAKKMWEMLFDTCYAGRTGSVIKLSPKEDIYE